MPLLSNTCRCLTLQVTAAYGELSQVTRTHKVIYILEGHLEKCLTNVVLSLFAVTTALLPLRGLIRHGDNFFLINSALTLCCLALLKGHIMFCFLDSCLCVAYPALKLSCLRYLIFLLFDTVWTRRFRQKNESVHRVVLSKLNKKMKQNKPFRFKEALTQSSYWKQFIKDY